MSNYPLNQSPKQPPGATPETTLLPAQNRWQAQVDAATRTIAANPDNPAAYIGRGHAYRNLQLYDQAIADYTQAMNLDPNSVEAATGWSAAYTCNFGLLQHQGRQYAAAIASFSNALALDPADPAAYRLRGDSLLELGDYTAATSDLNTALNLDPNNHLTLYLLAVCYATDFDSDAAAQCLTAACTLNPATRLQAGDDERFRPLCHHDQQFALIFNNLINIKDLTSEQVSI